ncbi:small ribosomal subunit protein mS40 [Armigeres subalbatus]|uniref:small ribosomal subunit protein mS40 n=1 Tax=Armigeres subalbatus TaxID=124917 RepID=UPI002ED6BBA6
MSLLRVLGCEILSIYRQGIIVTNHRSFLTSAHRFADQTASSEVAEGDQAEGEEEQSKGQTREDPKDRTRIIPVETSIRYLASEAYQQTYQGDLVWKQYRRNHKGLYPPNRTRKTCIRKGKLSTGNPCPICRDEYLVLDHRNVDLIKQFISSQNGKVLSYQITGLCQKRHQELLVVVQRAMDYGLITFDVPFRNYDYSEYYQAQKQ